MEKVQDSIGSLAFDEVLSYLGTFPTEFWSEIDISSGDREYIAAASQNASNGLTGDASSWFTFSPDTDRVAASETIIRNETAILQQRINDAIDQHNVLAAEHRSLINVYQQIQAKIIEFRALSTQIDEENKDVSSKETQYQDQALSIFEENLESLRQEVNTAVFAPRLFVHLRRLFQLKSWFKARLYVTTCQDHCMLWKDRLAISSSMHMARHGCVCSL